MSEKVKPWDERYSKEEFYYGKEPNDFLKSCAHQIKAGGKVLCLAEGEGRNAVYLAGLGFQVVAVDQSPQGLEKLKRFAKDQGVTVETHVADLENFEILPHSFDAIVSIWCHVPEKLRVTLHQKVVHALNSNGVMILESYHPRQLEYKTGGPPTADLMMTPDQLSRELAGLHFEILHETDRMVQEGKGHFGKSAVTQCLARKTKESVF